MKKRKELSSTELAHLIVDGMQEKKANEIVLMDLRKVKNAFADYFVVCSGNSDTQVDAISKSIEETVFKKSNEDPWHREGHQNREWILLDYVDVIAHVFTNEKRNFFDIESLWGDAECLYFNEEMKPALK